MREEEEELDWQRQERSLEQMVPYPRPANMAHMSIMCHILSMTVHGTYMTAYVSIRTWHICDSQGLIMAVAFRCKS